MKRILVFLLLLPTLSFAQAFWQVRAHSLDSDQLGKEIDALWAAGYSPIGMELYDNKLFMLYIHYQDFASDYNLEVIDLTQEDETSLPAVIDARIADQWMPVSISVFENQLFIIYLKTKLEILEWDISALPPSYKEQEDFLNDKGQDGLVPIGVSSPHMQKYSLLLRLKDWNVQEWLLQSYKPESRELRNGLNTALREGWIPWGLMMREEEFVVLYIKQ